MNPIEKKFFELSVLGILADRQKIEEYYDTPIAKNQTIIDFFIEKENMQENAKLQIEQWINQHQEKINKIRSLATYERQIGFKKREIFLKWYLTSEKQCCYCGVKEEDLNKYFNKDNLQYKTARQRGTSLEIERIITAPKEKNIYSEENCALACYICNNAKSDFISPQDFKSIAKGINQFWVDKVGVNAVFPKNSDIWDKTF